MIKRKFSNKIEIVSLWIALSFLSIISLLSPEISIASVRSPVSATFATADNIVIGKQMTIYIALEAFEDMQNVDFQVIMPNQGWQLVGGQTGWTGALTAGKPVQFEMYVIPTVQAPEPIRGRVSVPGWADTEWAMDMSRVGGKTPEKSTEADIAPQQPLNSTPPQVPQPRPQWEQNLPKPGSNPPVEPKIPGQGQAPINAVNTQVIVDQGIGDLVSVRATGRFVYTEQLNAGGTAVRGLRFATVQIMDDDGFANPDDQCAIATTDVNGNYDLSGSCSDGIFGGGPDIYIRVSASSSAADVRPTGIFSGTYRYESGRTNNYGGGTINYGTRNVPNDGAYHIYNVEVESWQYIKGQGSTVPKVITRWPLSSGGAFYNGEVNIPSSRTWRENVVSHEYGHHVLSKLAESPSPDYNNGICDGGSPGHCLWAPEKGVISWTEGWPDFFSDVIVTVYNHDNRYGFETHSDGAYLGQEAQIEGFVAAILFDLYDSAHDDQHSDGAGRRDRMSIGFNEQWDVIINYNPPGGNTHPVSIHQFWNGMRVRHGSQRNLLGEVYGEHHIVKPQPDLVVTSLSNPPSTLIRGKSFSVTRTVRNSGNELAVNSSTVRYYLSTNTFITSGDTLLTGTSSVPSLGIGATNTFTHSVTIPSSMSPGLYYLGACSDDLGTVPESNEGNNCRASGTRISVTTPPDLTMTAVGGPGGTFDAGNTFSVSSTVKNWGGAASGAFVVRFYLSTNSIISSSDIALSPDRLVSSLNGGASSSGNTTVTIPAATPAGTYFVGACADANRAVAESNESNNCRSDGTIEVVSSSVLDVGITGAVEMNSDVAYNPVTQQYLTVWQSGSSIMGEIRDKDGNIVKSDFAIMSGFLFSGYSEPAVTYKSGQNIFMVAAKRVTSLIGTTYRIVARRVSATGSPLGSDINLSTVSSVAVTFDGRPDIAADTVGSNCCILAVWKQAESIRGQRINGDGTLTGGNFTIRSAFPGTVAPTPAVTYQRFPFNDFLVVYKVLPELANPFIARKVVQPSASVSSELVIATGTGVSNPDVAYNESGDTYLVVWEDGSIKGQRLSSLGSKVGANFTINAKICIFFGCTSTGDPAVASATDSSNFLVTYYQSPAIGLIGDLDRDLFGKQVTTGGTVASGFLIFRDKGQNDQNPAAAYGSGPKKFMVAWDHVGSTMDVFGKLISGFQSPNSPLALRQLKSNGTTVLSVGAWTNETTVVMDFNMTDPNNPETLTPEVEIRAVGTAFTGTPTDSGNPVVYTGTAVKGKVTVTGLANGTQYHWRARVKDSYGHTSAWVSFGGNIETMRDVGVDTALPTGTVKINGNAPYTKTASVTLNLTCTDPAPGSGCAKMQFSNNNVVYTAFEPFAATKAWTFPAGDGTKLIYVRYQDRVGNISAAVRDDIRLDTTPPSVAVSAPAAGAFVSGIEVVIASASDAGSGVKDVQFFIGAVSIGTDTTSPYSRPWNTTAFADGSYNLTARATDNAGNVATSAIVTVKVDNTSPAGTIKIKGGKRWTKKLSVPLNLTCTDGTGSGCSKMQFSNDNVIFTALEPFAASKTWTLTAGDGTKTVYVRFADAQGNLSNSFSDTIKLDQTKPVLTGVSDTPDPFSHHLGETSTINFTLSDNMAKKCTVVVKVISTSTKKLVKKIRKRKVSCPTGGAAGSVVWDGTNKVGSPVPAGIYRYKVIAVDKAKNRSKAKGKTTVQ